MANPVTHQDTAAFEIAAIINASFPDLGAYWDRRGEEGGLIAFSGVRGVHVYVEDTEFDDEFVVGAHIDGDLSGGKQFGTVLDVTDYPDIANSVGEYVSQFR